MDIVEVIRERRSIRAFKPDAVPQEILKEIMGLALRAPSWGNTQPWEFAIVSGEKLEEIKQGFVAKSDDMPNPDLAAPQEYTEPFRARRRAIGKKLFDVRGISRDDWERRKVWQVQGLRLFEAPAAIYIFTDRTFHLQSKGLNMWPVFDCGMIAENIVLLAAAYGLGTIPQIQAVNYPDVLRKILGIPDSKLMVLGIAIGYPDWDDPINQIRSDKEPIDKVTTWYGFE